MKFSVIIPCYNHAHFLNDSLSSLLSQSYSDWEAIIVNDGSTDNTIVVASNWCNLDSRIKLVSISNKGLSTARNKGFEFSSGDFIALLDSDDKYASNHLELISKLFKEDADLVFTGYTYFSDNAVVNHNVNLSAEFNFSQILNHNIVPPVAVAFKRTLLLQSGYFDSSLKSAEDWDLWIRFFKIGAKLSILEKSSCYYRISENSMSRQFLSMYDALKTVSLRAYNYDSRIFSEYTFNFDYKNLLEESIKRSLMMCVGVAIFQEKYDIAYDLFIKESIYFGFSYKETDFRLMCSYLNFRYNTSSKDLDWVFGVIRPRFKKFIDILNLKGIDKEHALSEIFAIHNKIRFKKSFGFLSPLINQISWK
jgi:glycosyltransferase involved in cell wall biosynthesis